MINALLNSDYPYCIPNIEGILRISIYISLNSNYFHFWIKKLTWKLIFLFKVKINFLRNLPYSIITFQLKKLMSNDEEMFN